MIACDAMGGIADKIKAMRQRHGLTQEDLVAKSGVSLATVQRAERGAPLSAASLASIAAAFGVPASEISDDEPETFEPYLPLTLIESGRGLVAVLRSSVSIHFSFCELDDLEDAKAIEAFYEFCQSIVAIEGGMSPIAQVTRELDGKDHLKALAARGFIVGGARLDITAHDIDDDGGMGMSVLMGKWDETRAVLSVGRTPEDVSRAHLMDELGLYEVPNGGMIYPPSPPDDGGWDAFAAEISKDREA